MPKGRYNWYTYYAPSIYYDVMQTPQKFLEYTNKTTCVLCHAPLIHGEEFRFVGSQKKPVHKKCDVE